MDPALEGPIGSAASSGQIDDLDGFVADQVVAVSLEEMLGRERPPHPLLAPPRPGKGTGEGAGELFEALVSLRNSGFTVVVIVISNPESFGRVRPALEAEGVQIMHVGSEAELNVISL